MGRLLGYRYTDTRDILVYGELVDIDGSGGHFSSDQPLGTKPTLYLTLTPARVKNFMLENVRFYMNPTNNVTYELYLLEGSYANIVESSSSVVFDSLGGKTKGSRYISIRGNQLPIEVNLAEAGRLYYLIDWSADPGVTPGYIVVRGRVLA